MILHRTKAFAALAALLVLTASLSLISGSAQASAKRTCKHVSASVSKRTVADNGWVRVSGRTCHRAERPRRVRMQIRAKAGWRTVGSAATHRSGAFSKKVRISLPKGQEAADIRAVAATATSRRLRVRVANNQTVTTPSKSGGACPLSQPGSQIGLTLTGCRILGSDTAQDVDPTGFWGRVDCGTWPNLIPTRQTRLSTDGDTHPTATGAPQPDSAFRRLTVMDGDDVAGERCELGLNDNVEGPTAFYHEGQRRATYASIRLPSNFPLAAQTWQTILQMKQAQPAANAGGVPILEMQAWNNTFYVSSDKQVYFSFPATSNVWTRFVFDVTYSADPAKGSVQVSVDLNDDGDIDDAGERSPRVFAATLKTETTGGLEDTIAPGESIPSHLRTGLYHNPVLACPPPNGCSTEVDNVQVLAP